MMYKIFSIMFIMMSFFSSNSLNIKNNFLINNEDDTILWSNNRKLTWDDFKGVVPNTTEPFVSAMSACSIKIQYKNSENTMVDYKIVNYFIKSKSWTISKDTGLLAHEQLHFDISELFARKIRKSLDSLRSKKDINLDIYLEIYKSNVSKCEKFQYLYDHKVSNNNKNQQEWIKKVGAELLRLKKYEYISEE